MGRGLASGTMGERYSDEITSPTSRCQSKRSLQSTRSLKPGYLMPTHDINFLNHKTRIRPRIRISRNSLFKNFLDRPFNRLSYTLSNCLSVLIETDSGTLHTFARSRLRWSFGWFCAWTSSCFRGGAFGGAGGWDITRGGVFFPLWTDYFFDAFPEIKSLRRRSRLDRTNGLGRRR